MRLGLITRCKEEPYIDEFVKYYFFQGVNVITIIDDDSHKKRQLYHSIIQSTEYKVNIFKGELAGDLKNMCTGSKVVNLVFDKDIIKKNSANAVYKKIKQFFNWMMYIDVDEFIATRRNERNTIRDELLTTFKDVTCVKVPWVLMSSNSIENNPLSLLDTNVYRWDFDKKHENPVTDKRKFRCRYDAIECKCIFKPAFFHSLLKSDHYPGEPRKGAIVVESVANTTSVLDPFYQNLREKDISVAYLVCYHYRIISVQQCRHKIKTNVWYMKYTLNDLLSTDYPEIVDETMRNKNKKHIILDLVTSMISSIELGLS